jgi:hypothetical protein
MFTRGYHLYEVGRVNGRYLEDFGGFSSWDWSDMRETIDFGATFLYVPGRLLYKSICLSILQMAFGSIWNMEA